MVWNDHMPNDGLCPHCGFANGRKFGDLQCGQCGKEVYNDDLTRKVFLMGKRQWLITILGGFALGGAIVMLGGIGSVIDWQVAE
jgi:hypothetical protein